MKNFFFEKPNNFNYSKFNEEMGITSSIAIKCDIDGIEIYGGMNENGYAFSPSRVVEIDVMQGKTRSGISVKYERENKYGKKVISKSILFDVEQESALRIIEYIRNNR